MTEIVSNFYNYYPSIQQLKKKNKTKQKNNKTKIIKYEVTKHKHKGGKRKGKTTSG